MKQERTIKTITVGMTKTASPKVAGAKSGIFAASPHTTQITVTHLIRRPSEKVRGGSCSVGGMKWWFTAVTREAEKHQAAKAAKAADHILNRPAAAFTRLSTLGPAVDGGAAAGDIQFVFPFRQPRLRGFCPRLKPAKKPRERG